MIKQLLAKNKIVQRVKAVKDLFLEKLDSLSHVQLEQIQKLEKLNQLDPFTFQKIARDVRQDSQKHSDLILDSFQRIYEAYQQQSDAIFATIQKIQENLHQISEENRQIFEDIHSQKYKVITDQQYFQDLDIELMTYLYSYLPYRLAVDIGANRGDVSSRLLQAGYQVYAFEPFPPVIDKLKNRLGDHPNFQLFPLAIGSENQTQELHIATDETADNTYQDASFYNSLTKHSLSEGLVFNDTITVTVKTLASLHDAEELPKDIGLVKIDTEGFDLEVIKGMGNYRYPVVVAEFWDQNFPFGRSGAMNKLPDLVNAMKERDYHWHLVIYRIWGSSDVSYYCNSAYSLDNSWGNVFFFLGIAFLLVGIFFGSRLQPVWIDEVMLAEPAANLALYDSFTSAAWWHQNAQDFHVGVSFLYTVLLALWIKVLGFSIEKVRLFNYVLMLLSITLIWLVIKKLALIKFSWLRIILVVSCLLPAGITFIYTSGRYDTSCIFLSALVWGAFLIKDAKIRCLTMTIIGFFFPLSGLSAVVFAIIFGVILLLFNFQRFWREFVALGGGFILGMLFLYALYSTNGVWDDFVSLTLGQSVANANLNRSVIDIIFSRVSKLFDKDYICGGCLRDASFPPLSLLLIILIFYELLTKSFRWRSPSFFALISVITRTTFPSANYLRTMGKE